MKLFLTSHTTAINTARGIDGLNSERNIALLSLHIKHDWGFCEDIGNKITVHNTTPNSTLEVISTSQKRTKIHHVD